MKILLKILLAFMVIGIKGDAPQFNVGKFYKKFLFKYLITNTVLLLCFHIKKRCHF